MRRALVVSALLLLPGSPAPGATFGEPTTVPPGVLEMAPRDHALVMLRALKGPPAEDREPAATVMDWYPAPFGFRVTGGFRDVEDPRDRRGSFAPYLGFGWQGALLNDSLLVGLDFGALYRGRPDVRVAETAVDPAGERRRPALPAPLEPVVSITFTYRF